MYMSETTSWLSIVIIVIIGLIALTQNSGANLLPIDLGNEPTLQENATTTPEE